MRDHRVAVQGGVEVSGQVEESLLDVEDQEQLLFVLANAPQEDATYECFCCIGRFARVSATFGLFDQELCSMQHLRANFVGVTHRVILVDPLEREGCFILDHRPRFRRSKN